jgi:hypothetical protein
LELDRIFERGNAMLRDATFVVLGFIVLAAVTQAQEDPFVGTWKLNLAQSKYGTTQPPKSMMRTVVAQGGGYKIAYEGVGSDGSRIAYSYVTSFDGKDVPVSGMGQPDGADTIAATRDARTATETFKTAGKVVAKAQGALSRNGKSYVVSSNGYPSPGGVLAIYEKQ